MKKSCHKFIIRSIIKIFNSFLLYFNHFHNLTVILEIYIILIYIYIYYFSYSKSSWSAKHQHRPHLKRKNSQNYIENFQDKSTISTSISFPEWGNHSLFPKLLKNGKQWTLKKKSSSTMTTPMKSISLMINLNHLKRNNLPDQANKKRKNPKVKVSEKEEFHRCLLRRHPKKAI